MSNIILFALLSCYADWEAAYLAAGLRTLGDGRFEVRTLSLSTEPVESIGGFRSVPDFDLQTVPSEYAALMLIGGTSWRTERAQKLRPLAEDCLRSGQLLGGICDASTFLGAIGALNGVRHTSNDLDDLKRWAGSAYTGESRYVCAQAVRDGNIVTANGTAALEFAQEVLLALNAAPEDQIEAWYRFHKLGYCDAMQG